MRHFIDHRHHKPHTPTPDFKHHSRFLLVLVVLSHPFIAYACIKIAESITKVYSEFATGLTDIRSGDAFDAYETVSIDYLDVLFPRFLMLTLFIVALLAGHFRVFRIDRFWPNFIVSLILLVIGLMVISGGNIGELFS